MDAPHLVQLLARAVDKNGVDPDHLNLTTTNKTLISLQRKYCTVGVCPPEWAIVDYQPTFAGNTVYLACFGILLIAQLFFGIKKKTWTFMVAVCLGTLGEAVGYVGRLMLSKNNFPMNNFLVNLVPLTVAPALLTGGIYLCLSRIIVAIGTEYSRLKPKLYTYIFIACDLLSLVLQAAGAAMASMAKDDKGSKRGVNIMIGGLVSQIISMIIFFILWGDFAFRVRRAKSSGKMLGSQPPLYEQLRADRAFHWFQISLFVATLCIFIRSIYRVAELWGGFNSHLANDEITFMIFEGPFIIPAITLLTVYHPGTVFDDLWVPAGKGFRHMKHTDSGSVSMEPLANSKPWKADTSYERMEV